MTEIIQASVFITGQHDIIRARTIGSELARSSGFNAGDQVRLATAISELTRNALDHANGGICTLSTMMQDDGLLIRVVVSDDGPGFLDAPPAFQPTRGGRGQGLPAVRRLMGNLTIASQPGRSIVEFTMGRRG